MKTKIILPNHIKEVCQERGISVRELAKKIGVSSSQMDRIVGGKEQPTLSETMKICGVLNTDSYKIFGLTFDKKLVNNLDDVLLGSVTVWLAEACNLYKVHLTKAEYSQWVSFIYREVVTRHMNGAETQHLATVVVKIIDQIKRKKKKS
jgi:transcriptional regulator with XRE-family HTH domain